MLLARQPCWDHRDAYLLGTWQEKTRLAGALVSCAFVNTSVLNFDRKNDGQMATSLVTRLGWASNWLEIIESPLLREAWATDYSIRLSAANLAEDSVSPSDRRYGNRN